jgi:hypothetical protein
LERARDTRIDAKSRRDPAHAEPSARLALGPLPARERAEILGWLDAGLRGGRPGALLAEYPGTLGHAASLHARMRVGGRPASHALGRFVRTRARGRSIAAGMIGSVYTDPLWRNRGFAHACVRSCTEKLAAGGALVIALWSDLDELYAPLGFRRAATEWIYELEERKCRVAAAQRTAAFEVAAAQAGDWSALEAMYAAKSVRADRRPGSLAELAAAPACTTLVARRGGVPVAYASLGRGDDFAGFIHEWAGDGDGVLACFTELCAAHGPLRCLAGPIDEEPLALLRAAGAPSERRAAGLFAVPDPVRLWRAVAADAPSLAGVALSGAGRSFRIEGEAGHVDLDYDEIVALLLGPERPQRAAAALSPAQYLGVRASCPLPLYLWGFDSI